MLRFSVRHFTAKATITDIQIPTRRKWARHVVPDGSRVIAFGHDGQYEIVHGPAVRWWRGQKVAPLKNYVVSYGSMINLYSRDGSIRSVAGPALVWQDPVEEVAAEIIPAMNLPQGSCVVVYEKSEAETHRTIIRGPSQFFLKPSQWLHQFVWTGAVQRGELNIKAAGALKFQELRTLPDQLYCDLEVRSKDGELLNLKLMLFYRLTHVETMLDETADPISELINGVTADVINFTAERVSTDFKRDSFKLNDIFSFTQLVVRARKMGFEVDQVVFRGFTTSSKLQSMMDSFIEDRTQMELEQEKEEQRQKLEAFKLRELEQRSETQRRMEITDKQHSCHLARLGAVIKAECDEIANKQLLELDRAKQEHEQQMEALKLTETEVRSQTQRRMDEVATKHSWMLATLAAVNKVEVEDIVHKQTRDHKVWSCAQEIDELTKKQETRLQYWLRLKEMGVDLTRVLASQDAKTYKFECDGSNAGLGVNVHVKE
jgi:hypothetical protein